LRVRREPKAKRLEVASRTAASLSLSALLERRPGQLSGGQQQRVALARAVAVDADVLLLDEPLSNLDARLRLEARTFLKRLQRELGVTTVFVTHDQAEALALADRIAVMESGKIRQLGSPREVFGRPADTFVANFIGSTPMNLLDAVIVEGQIAVAGAKLPSPLEIEDDTKVVVGIRPEYLTLETDGPGIGGTVSTIENLGVSSLVTLECPDGTLVGLTVREQHEPAIGSQVTAAAEPGRLLLYSKETGILLSR
jgi:multiple sugar transport system ATP-binding protein